MDDIANLFDALSICNIKLFNCCDVKAKIAAHPEDFTKEEMAANARADIELCKKRSELKNKINSILGAAVTKEIKNYGP